jgi:hypothetical protein
LADVPTTVFDELENYHEVSKYNYDWSGLDDEDDENDDYRTYRDFDSTSTVIITNAKKEHGKNSS